MTGRPRHIDREAVATLFLGGMSHADIADRLGFPAGSIRKIICRLGLSTPRKRTKPREKVVPDTAWQRDIIAAYVAGEPVDAIAERFGCHRSYPGHLAKRRAHGVRLERSGISTQERERLVELRKASNVSVYRLAARLGIDRLSLTRWETGEYAPLAFNLSCWREAIGVRE